QERGDRGDAGQPAEGCGDPGHAEHQPRDRRGRIHGYPGGARVREEERKKACTPRTPDNPWLDLSTLLSTYSSTPMTQPLWQKSGVQIDARIMQFLAGDDVLLDREFFLHDI